MLTLIIIFWVSLGLIIYTLIGYPLIVLFWGLTYHKTIDKKPIVPSVSFIIAAYNEELVIEQKINQTLALDYPRDKLEIIVASDGSTDRTDEIVRKFQKQGVKLFRSEHQSGKTITLNGAVATAKGDIVIFSDATGFYNNEAIRELVANFNDLAIGCVTGRVVYSYGTDTVSKGFKFYQQLAVTIRRAESLFGSQTSASGSIHAIRRNLYIPGAPAFTPDLYNPVHAVIQGYRVIYENSAISLEESRNKMQDEFTARVRNSTLSYSMIPYIFRLLLKHRKFLYTFQMLSHKVMRWFLWLPMSVVLIINMFLIAQSPLYLIFACIQCFVYGIGLVGFAAEKLKIHVPKVAPITFFILGNIATAFGAFRCLTGNRITKWQTIRL